MAAQSGDTRMWTVLCHASALVGFFVPAVGHIFGPLIVWLLKRGDSAAIDAHGKESVNFQLSLFIYSAVIVGLCFVIIGIFLLPLLFVFHIANVVLVIIASVQASDGRLYRYPFTLRLLK